MEFKKFEQIVRECYSKCNGNLMKENELELRTLAEKYDFDLDGILNILNSNKLFIEKNNPSGNICDPITDDICEAFILQYILKGKCSNYTLHLDSEISRGKNSLLQDSDFIKKCGFESMLDGVKIFIKKIEKGEIVNSYFYEKAMKIGISRLKEYVNNYDSKINNDVDVHNFLFEIYDKCYRYDCEHEMTKSSCSLFFNQNEDSSFRFYINMPINESSAQFIRDYIIMCQNAGVFYKLKPYFNDGEHKDVTILYSTIKDFKIKLNFIKKLLKEYPDMELGTPPFCTIDFGKIGICFDPSRCHMTYNSYVSFLFQNSIGYFVAKHCSGLNDVSKNKFLLFEKGELRNPFNYMSFISFSVDDRNVVSDFLSLYMKDPLKRKNLIYYVKYMVKRFHNMYQGFPIDYPCNVALDSRYIFEEYIALNNDNNLFNNSKK